VVVIGLVVDVVGGAVEVDATGGSDVVVGSATGDAPLQAPSTRQASSVPDRHRLVRGAGTPTRSRCGMPPPSPGSPSAHRIPLSQRANTHLRQLQFMFLLREVRSAAPTALFRVAATLFSRVSTDPLTHSFKVVASLQPLAETGNLPCVARAATHRVADRHRLENEVKRWESTIPAWTNWISC